MRGFYRNNAPNEHEMSNRTSSDESAATRVENTVVLPQDVEKTRELDDSKVPFLTVRTFVMAVYFPRWLLCYRTILTLL